jgi:hypothetical protein
MTITSSTYPVVYGLASDFTSQSQINPAVPQLGYATDTNAWYFHAASASTWSLVSGGGTSVTGSSAGMTAASNLTGITPSRNGLFSVEAFLNITSYSSGSIGFAVTYTKATVGASAIKVQKYLVKELTINNILKSNALATAGAATGAYAIPAKSFYASGGLAITPAITLTGSSKCTVYYKITQLA